MQANRGETSGGIASMSTEPAWQRSLRNTLQPTARWLGILYLVFSLGGNMLLRLEPASPRPWFEPVLLIMTLAVLLVGVPLVARVWLLWVPLGLLTVWIGAAVVSTLALTGSVAVGFLKWTLILAALFVSAAVTRPLWSGWAVLILGSLHIAAHVVVYWKNYFSLGASFSSAGSWWSSSYGWSLLPLPARSDWAGPSTLIGLPYPQGVIERVEALVFEVPDLVGYQFFGLTGNPNYTADYLAPFLVFAAAFLVRPVGTHLAAPVRLAAGTAVLLPGLWIIHVLDARSAVTAVLIGLLLLVVPVAWSRRGAFPYAAAVAAPLLLLAPPITSWLTAASLSGRGCVWRSWVVAVRESPLWGVGAPGQLSDTCASSAIIVNAHNELLQSWSIGGLLGLAGFVGFFVIVTFQAVRHSDLDGRVLLSVMAASVALLGMEVLSTDWALGWVVPLIARSLALYATTEPVPSTVREDYSRQPGGRSRESL